MDRSTVDQTTFAMMRSSEEGVNDGDAICVSRSQCVAGERYPDSYFKLELICQKISQELDSKYGNIIATQSFI